MTFSFFLLRKHVSVGRQVATALCNLIRHVTLRSFVRLPFRAINNLLLPSFPKWRSFSTKFCIFGFKDLPSKRIFSSNYLSTVKNLGWAISPSFFFANFAINQTDQLPPPITCLKHMRCIPVFVRQRIWQRWRQQQFQPVMSRFSDDDDDVGWSASDRLSLTYGNGSCCRGANNYNAHCWQC